MERVTKQIKYNYSVRKEPIKYIVIHDTGNPDNGSDAQAHYNYFNGGNRGSSADIFVDDHSAWTVNDYNRYYSWHCGDGSGRYGITNGNSVGIEMCINSDGDYDKAFANTVAIARELMQKLNIPIDRVVRHYDASRKNCPMSMSGSGWARWKQFKQKLSESEDEPMTNEERAKFNALVGAVEKLANPMVYNYIDDNMPTWAKPTVQKLVDKKALKGDGNGLGLTDELLRILVINDRMGLYD